MALKAILLCLALFAVASCGRRLGFPRLRVPTSLWCIHGAVAVTLAIGVVGALPAETPGFLPIAGAVAFLLATWPFTRTDDDFTLPFRTASHRLRRMAVLRRRRPPPTDPARTQERVDEAHEKHRETRRGPRWMTPPIVRRYGLRQPDD